ncbi:MAG: hypothetical protein KIT68_08995 [Phycisphaeraceae bacterium]|nr:hypothetical protein [Phycisphaeraceae bacterium]
MTHAADGQQDDDVRARDPVEGPGVGGRGRQVLLVDRLARGGVAVGPEQLDADGAQPLDAVARGVEQLEVAGDAPTAGSILLQARQRVDAQRNGHHGAVGLGDAAHRRFAGAAAGAGAGAQHGQHGRGGGERADRPRAES